MGQALEHEQKLEKSRYKGPSLLLFSILKMCSYIEHKYKDEVKDLAVVDCDNTWILCRSAFLRYFISMYRDLISMFKEIRKIRKECPVCEVERDLSYGEIDEVLKVRGEDIEVTSKGALLP